MYQPEASSMHQSQDSAFRSNLIAYQHMMSDFKNIETKYQGVYFQVVVEPKERRYPTIWPIVIRNDEHRVPDGLDEPIVSVDVFEKRFAQFQKSKQILQNLMRQAIETRDRLQRQFDERYYNVVIKKMRDEPYY